MMTQSDLEGIRHRLLAVLWERLAELEADATREAIGRRTDWGDPIFCPHCKQEASRFRDGVCLPCVANQREKAYQMAGRLSQLIKRYPKLTRGLRKRAAKAKCWESPFQNRAAAAKPQARLVKLTILGVMGVGARAFTSRNAGGRKNHKSTGSSSSIFFRDARNSWSKDFIRTY